MKKKIKKTSGKSGFSIVELLTVMSIIVILIGILLPSINYVRRYARDVKQKAQFHALEIAIEMFHNSFGAYPPSDANDPDNKPYCGAAKLCEALMGYDLMGFNPSSKFLYNGGNLYNNYTLDKRIDRFLPLESAGAHKLWHIWGGNNSTKVGTQNAYLFVICDVYGNFRNYDPNGKGNIGMPVLYYKANTASTIHDSCQPSNINIYNFLDNDGLVREYNPLNRENILSSAYPSQGQIIPPPPPPSGKRLFYDVIRDKTLNISWPCRSDSYILMSAGWDGVYGTKDDIFNFKD